MLDELLDSLRSLVKDRRLVTAILPIFIGLLPSAGGARFSAPMVEESSRGLALSPEKKAYINYWFRHLWEYVLPLYPGILLAAQITSLPLHTLILYQLPYPLLAIGLGFLLGLRTKNNDGQTRPALEARTKAGQLLNSLWPILTVIFLVLILRWNLSLSLSLVLLALLLVKKYSFPDVLQMTKEAFSLKIVILLAGVFIFKDMLMASGAVQALPLFFAGVGIPSLAVIILLPFLVGFLTGITQAYVGVTFPILLGLTSSPALFSLAFVAGFAGVMLSPVHLCLVLTVDYFKADWSPVYRLLSVSVTMVLLGALGITLLGA